METNEERIKRECKEHNAELERIKNLDNENKRLKAELEKLKMSPEGEAQRSHILVLDEAQSWRYSMNGIPSIYRGTLRMFRVDIDTNPSTEYIEEILKKVCNKLNS